MGAWRGGAFVRHVGGSALPVSLEGMVRKEGRMSQKKKQLNCQRPNPPSPSPFLHSLPPSPPGMPQGPSPRPRHPPPPPEEGGGGGSEAGGGGGGEEGGQRDKGPGDVMTCKRVARRRERARSAGAQTL